MTSHTKKNLAERPANTATKPLPLPLCEIAISGAGDLAGLHCGAISALWPVTRPSMLIGTSAGAIVAGLLSLGHCPDRLHDIVVSADYRKLIPMRPWLAPFRGYLANNRNVISWLKDITNMALMGDCVIPYTAITSDLNTGKARTWDSWLLPEMPVWEAVLSSMSIPDVFPAWKKRYEDGGMVDNLGINYLPGKHKRLGLRITEHTRVGPIRGIIERSERELGIMLGASEHDMCLLAEATKTPIVRLPAGNLGFLQTDMTQAQKMFLYQQGLEVTNNWMKSGEGMRWLARA